MTIRQELIPAVAFCKLPATYQPSHETMAEALAAFQKAYEVLKLRLSRAEHFKKLGGSA